MSQCRDLPNVEIKRRDGRVLEITLQACGEFEGAQALESQGRRDAPAFPDSN